MTHIYIVYASSVLLQLIPLLHLIAQRHIQQYVVFAAASSGFLFLNLAGSVSGSVTQYQSLPFHYANLAIAGGFAATYLILRKMSAAASYIPLSDRFAAGADSPRRYHRYLLALMVVHLAALAVFTWLGALPLVFRFDLFGDWSALVQERIRIVQHPGFYWFALAIFEIPLFATLLCVLLWPLASGPRQLRLVRSSRPRYYPYLVAYSLLLSMIYLNKQYLMYLLAALLLAYIVRSNRVPLRQLIFVAITALVLLFGLYKLYAGSVTIGSILQIIGHRIVEVYPWAGAVAFDLFPAEMDFLKGTSIVNPRGIFPYTQVIVGDLLYPYIYADIGYGNAPLPAIYENYVNFGWWGIAAGIVLVCLIIVALTRLSWSRSFFMFALSLLLTVKTLLLWQAPFWFGMVEPTLAALVCGLLLLRLLTHRSDMGSHRKD